MNATETLRTFLESIYCGHREQTLAAVAALHKHLEDGGDFPTIDLLGPVECRYPDPDRMRIAV